MHLLRRTVRFSVNPVGAGSRLLPPSSDPNGFGGEPAMRGLGRHYELDVSCRGDPNPASGYLLNIKEIDRAVRAHGLPVIERACAERPECEPGEVIGEVLEAVCRGLAAPVDLLRWRLSPTYAVEMTTSAPDRVVLRQQFDFSAAHRLNAASLGEDENRRLFGKCNNPSGHGHNYRVEPAVGIRLTNGMQTFSLVDLERCVDRVILQRLDHKHLNLDTPEFSDAGGLNPSVEHIARLCFELLSPEIERASNGAAALIAVTVWETDRTSCTYPG